MLCCIASVYECNFFGKTVEWNVHGGIIKSKSCKILYLIEIMHKL